MSCSNEGGAGVEHGGDAPEGDTYMERKRERDEGKEGEGEEDAAGGRSAGGGNAMEEEQKSFTEMEVSESPATATVNGGTLFLSKLNSNNHRQSENSPPRKRLKFSECDKSSSFDDIKGRQRKEILEYKVQRLRSLKERFTEAAHELFFLQAGGNMMDYVGWRKRPPAQQLLEFLDQRSPWPTSDIDEKPIVQSASVKHSIDGGCNESARCGIGAQEEIVEKAKQEAFVAGRVVELQRAGLWASGRLPRVLEPPRAKAHWDYLLEEMAWIAQDFAAERKWKKAAAKKCARMVQKHFHEKAQAAQKAEKAQELQLRRIAAYAAKEIKTFWSNVEKLVELKRSSKVEKKRKVALDQQLSFIVDQTERYSQQLAKGMNVNEVVDTPPSDDEFEPEERSSDDEETIAAAEREAAAAPDDTRAEVEALTRESRLDLADVLRELPPNYLSSTDRAPPSPPPSPSTAPSASGSASEEYSAREDSADEEETIAEEEKLEGETGAEGADEEIRRLRAEGEMNLDELMKLYGAPAPQVVLESDRDADDETEETSSEAQPDDEDTEEEDTEEEDTEEEENEGEENEEEEEEAGVANERETRLEVLVEDAAALAASIQPTGTTLSETSVGTSVPRLLKHSLREYQHVGLHWLATMHVRHLNGILADEMGLGKTIQTIALLAHLALDSAEWGPHLVVAPTSVVLNWEMEFKKWCPSFKILTYYGNMKERKAKRVGWTKADSFHVCITSYKLVVQDHQSFRRKRWKYLILDEAQNIKNFKSQRWQILLNFQTERRLLLTGTPLQNNLLELWSLMHFLMPDVFASHSEFKEWFSPVAGMIDGSQHYNDDIVRRLHKVLRPFLLRRLKADVEKQMPKKYEHVLMCRLSKRQRYLYDDFMSRSKTKESLASGNLLSVINILMQLRKVCNHPDLFEPRPVISPLHMEPLEVRTPADLVFTTERVEVAARLGGDLASLEVSGAGAFACHRARHLAPPRRLIEELPPYPPTDTRKRPPPAALRLHLHMVARTPLSRAPPPPPLPPPPPPRHHGHQPPPPAPPPDAKPSPSDIYHTERWSSRLESRRRCCLRRLAFVNERRCWRLPLYGSDLRAALTLAQPPSPEPLPAPDIARTTAQMHTTIDRFTVCCGGVLAPPAQLLCPTGVAEAGGGGNGVGEWRRRVAILEEEGERAMRPLLRMFQPSILRQMVAFPHPRLLQYDCGKLQTLDGLLRELKSRGRRVLIFTQMTRVLDVLEGFLSMHGHTYLRLDGSTRVDARLTLVERFNVDRKLFAFILSTRSGGVGLNLTGADTVIFYDSDWNPTMDAQAQDRCHRIGQTKDVHVYRLVTANTVEENILRKAEQKRALGHVAIEDGHFTTSYLRAANIKELFGEASKANEMEMEMERDKDKEETASASANTGNDLECALAAAEDEADAMAARAARAEAQRDLAEFDENIPIEREEHENEKDCGRAARNEEEEAPPELRALIKQLTPVERYAMRLVEGSEAATRAERDAIEAVDRQLRDWENARRALLDVNVDVNLNHNVDVELRDRTDERNRRPPTPPAELTYEREDERNQMWVNNTLIGGALGFSEQMPVWCPPTPPQGDGDVYTERWARPLYRRGPAPDSQLPPVHRRSPRPRLAAPIHQRHYNAHGRPHAHRTHLHPHRALSLFDRGAPRPRPRPRHHAHREPERGAPPPPPAPEWSQAEDAALRRALRLQRLPPEPPPALTPNWDWAADLVAEVGRIYRSPRLCRDRYESVPRRRAPDSPSPSPPALERRKQRKGKPPRGAVGTPGAEETEPPAALARVEAIGAACQRKRSGLKCRYEEPPSDNGPTLATLFAETGLEYEAPPSPMDVASRRADRIAKEKMKVSAPAPPTTPTSGNGGTASAQPQSQSQPQPQPQRIVVAAHPVAAVVKSGGVGVGVGGSGGGAHLQLYRQQGFTRHHLKIVQQPQANVGGSSDSTSVAAAQLRTLQMQTSRPARHPHTHNHPHLVVAHLASHQHQHQQQQQPQQQQHHAERQ